jgi:hypothetical protein
MYFPSLPTPHTLPAAGKWGLRQGGGGTGNCLRKSSGGDHTSRTLPREPLGRGSHLAHPPSRALRKGVTPCASRLANTSEGGHPLRNPVANTSGGERPCATPSRTLRKGVTHSATFLAKTSGRRIHTRNLPREHLGTWISHVQPLSRGARDADDPLQPPSRRAGGPRRPLTSRRRSIPPRRLRRSGRGQPAGIARTRRGGRLRAVARIKGRIDGTACIGPFRPECPSRTLPSSGQGRNDV